MSDVMQCLVSMVCGIGDSEANIPRLVMRMVTLELDFRIHTVGCYELRVKETPSQVSRLVSSGHKEADLCAALPLFFHSQT